MTDIEKTALIGYPIQKSKSPIIYKYWMNMYGIDGRFDLLETPIADLKNTVQKIVDDNYAGFCVTIPHKQNILDFCDDVDDIARAIGATNSVVNKNGKLYATNTDAFGFIQNIKSNAPHFDFTGGAATILGAGGAARAVIYGLLAEGVPEIRISNRTRARAEELKSMAPHKIHVVDWDDREDTLSTTHLLVNTTSLGMDGQDALEIDVGTLPTSALVNDIVYYPLETNLLKSAKQNGNLVVTGIGMLVHQARPSFKNWYGIDPAVTPELLAMVLT